MALALITKTETRIDCTDVKAGDPVATIDTELDVDVVTEILNLGQLGIDGDNVVEIDAHSSDPIGKITTEHPRGNIASLLRSGMLNCIEIEDMQPSKRKRVTAPKSKTPTTQPPAPTTDPSDEDLDEESDEDEPSGSSTVAEVAKTLDASPGSQASPDAPKPDDEITIDASLDGLPVRIQKVLTVRGYATKAAIAEYVATGKPLDDIEDIGPKAAAQIQSWLGT